MAILKSEIRNKYSQIPNSIIRTKELTDGDYRLLIYLYSLPDKWKINQTFLASELGCNRRNINAKIKRLKESGYLEIIKADSTDKGTDYVYVLKNKDVSVTDELLKDVSMKDVSMKDVSVNDTHINTNKIKTELINTDIYYLLEERMGRTLNGNEAKKVENWLKAYNQEIVTEAINIADNKHSLNFGYIDGILRNWHQQGIKTIVDIKNKNQIMEDMREMSEEEKELLDYDWLNEED